MKKSSGKMLKVKRALISTYNKEGLADFSRKLRDLGIEIYSTGGTLAFLKKNKIKATSITKLTKSPEILEGRVKTLHPKIHGALLYLRDNKAQREEAKKHGIEPIDMAVINLYPFQEVIKSKNVSLATALENIDIGGPTMLRSAAKNFKSVAVVSDPQDYKEVISELTKNKGRISSKTLSYLATKVFRLTSSYDQAISGYLGGISGEKTSQELPSSLSLNYKKVKDLRYGENPHQKAALYFPSTGKPYLGFEQLHGKELSYNNILDLEAAWGAVEEFKRPAACVIKHNNPCGACEAASISQAIEGALAGDPLSSFGGIIGLNRTCDADTAKAALDKLGFFEVIAAPGYQERALSLLRSRKNLRIIKVKLEPERCPYALKFTGGSLLLQDRDPVIEEGISSLRKDLKCVTCAKPTPQEIDSLIFAWKIAKHVKSNAIVLAKDETIVGIGAGQMSRVDSVTMACIKGAARTRGSVLASDGFFPMADNIEVAASYGIKAIIQPGGSIKDKDVIETCDKHNIAMLFTGKRHFKH